MKSDLEFPSRFISCPICGLSQKITFVYDAVSVDQRCIGCGEYVLFQMPSPYSSMVSWIKRLRK